MANLPPKHKRTAAKGELEPVQWHLIEPHYKAGIRSIRSIAQEFGVSRTGIDKHAAKQSPPWKRSLAPAIHQQADRLVAQYDEQVASQARTLVAGGKLHATSDPAVPTDAEIVDAGAAQLAVVKLGHRSDIAALRKIVQGLLAELAVTMDRPDLFAQVEGMLSDPDEPKLQALEDAMALVASLPGRTKVAKDLAEALHKCIGMEREAFGLNTAGGTDGIPLVLIKDFTGKGDVDSPYYGKPHPGSEYE